MSHVEPGDTHDECRERLRWPRECACKHWDAHECLLLRYRGSPVPLDSLCECCCHDDSEEFDDER